MEHIHSYYFSRSIKIRDRIDAERKDLPVAIDEPVAIYTTQETAALKNLSTTYMALKPTLSEHKEYPYQRTSKQMRSVISSDATNCTIAYARTLPAGNPHGNPTTFWEPEVLLHSISSITPTGIVRLSESAYPGYRGLEAFSAIKELPARGALDFLSEGENNNNFRIYLRQRILDPQRFWDGITTTATRLCARLGYENCDIAFRLFLTRYEFKSNIPVNPEPSQIFSKETYLARREELLSRFREK